MLSAWVEWSKFTAAIIAEEFQHKPAFPSDIPDYFQKNLKREMIKRCGMCYKYLPKLLSIGNQHCSI